jgi:hypothetical protein
LIAVVALWLAAAPDPTLSPVGPNTLVTPLPEPPETSWTVPIVHGVGLLAGMRLALSVAWPEAYDPLPLSRSGHQFARAYRGPPEFRRDRWLLESDGDPWAINVIGHGLFGAEIYGRVRQCGGAPWQALAFAAGTSVVWEYGIESFSKRPSTIDLVATPLIGAALGETRFRTQRWLRRHPPGFWRRFGEILIDPLGEAERGVLKTRC